MAILSDNIKAAFEIKEEAVKKAEAIYEKSVNEAAINNPRITEINTMLSGIGASLMMAALSGNSDKIKELKKESEALSKEKKQLLKKSGVKEKECFCKVCNDTGYVGGKLCECIKSIAKDIAISRMAEKMPLDKCSFDNFDINYYPEETKTKMNNILSFTKKYADNFSLSSENLLFMGKCGLGKTHISLSIIKEVIKKGYNVVYGPAQNLFSQVEKEHFTYNGSTENLDLLLDADLLVIDDLGTEFMTNFVQSLFYDIVNTRMLKGRPTIINTNLNIDELQNRYTQRIASRFIGEYTIKTFLGSDIRLKKAQEK